MQKSSAFPTIPLVVSGKTIAPDRLLTKLLHDDWNNYMPTASFDASSLIQKGIRWSMDLTMLSSPIEFRHRVKKSILRFLHPFKHFLKCTTANTMAFTVAICHAITVYGVHMQSSHLYQLSSIRMARVQRSLWIGIATCTLAWVRFWKPFSLRYLEPTKSTPFLPASHVWPVHLWGAS